MPISASLGPVRATSTAYPPLRTRERRRQVRAQIRRAPRLARRRLILDLVCGIHLRDPLMPVRSLPGLVHGVAKPETGSLVVGVKRSGAPPASGDNHTGASKTVREHPCDSTVFPRCVGFSCAARRTAGNSSPCSPLASWRLLAPLCRPREEDDVVAVDTEMTGRDLKMGWAKGTRGIVDMRCRSNREYLLDESIRAVGLIGRFRMR